MLPLIWLAIIGFCIIMYVILDGFTLGTALLFPFLREQERDIAMSMLLPTWDGNQTWLVLGGASLYGAFPLAFSILLPVFYLPLLYLVVALLFRGVAFEFRLKAAPHAKKYWDLLFIAGSLVTTLVQGYVLGNFVQGFVLNNGLFDVRPDNILFTIMTALSLVFGYSLLGACRLILKTNGALQAKMYRLAKLLVLIVMLAIITVSIWTPFVYPRVQQVWFNLHYLPYLAILPAITAICFVMLLRALAKRREISPYWLAVLLFLCPYVGFIISIFPYIVPYQIDLWQAAADKSSLLFLLVGACIMLPVLLIYTGYAYRIFKGKVNETISY